MLIIFAMGYLWVLKMKNQLINKYAELNECVNMGLPLASRHATSRVDLALEASGEANDE